MNIYIYTYIIDVMTICFLKQNAIILHQKCIIL